MADITQIKVGSTTHDIKDNTKLSKVTYEWNKEFAAGSNGAVSLGRYNMYDTQLTFDITSTTTQSLSGKLVIATQNGSLCQAKVFGDASGTLVSKLIIYQSAISGNRSWIEVFCNFDGWSKNKVHIYGVALNSATVTNQMASVTISNGVPSGVTSGDKKWTGTIVNDITSNCASAAQGAKADTALQSITAVAGSNINSVGTPSVTASTSGKTSTLTFNYLKGATGAQGKQGPTGATGAQGKQGPTGATGGTGAKGPTGATGSQGKQGPTGAAGKNGTNGKQGPTGAKGSTGASSEWYTGTAITGTSTTATIFSSSGISSATVGDMYLNTSTYNVYRCSTAGAASAAKWVYVCNIKGATGGTGAQGKQGPTGSTGAKGNTGPQGPTGAAGKNGTNGTNGKQGPTGAQGKTGGTGPQGPTGAAGKNGTNGTNGTNGKQGPTGAVGATGSRGTGIYSITTAPTSYSTATGGFTPTYRIALSTVKTQSGAASIIKGDQLRYSYYVYPVGYVDSSYVYLGTRVSLRGATGSDGADGSTGPKGPTGAQGPVGPTGPAGGFPSNATVDYITINDGANLPPTDNIYIGDSGTTLSSILNGVLRSGDPSGTIKDFTCQYINSMRGAYDTADNIIYMSKHGATEDWVTENFREKCLLEGSLISMADGTKKPVEELKEGDLVKSINIETGEEVDSVVLSCKVGDVQNFYYMLVFEDGSSLKTNWTHDIYNATKGTWVKSDCEMYLDDEVIKEDGSQVKFIGAIDTIGTINGKRCKFYDIIVSNNCYYADGILCATNPVVQLKWLVPALNKKVNLIPQNLKDLIASYRDEDTREADLVHNNAYMAEYIPQMTIKMKKEARLRQLQAELSKTDYVSIKASEGVEITPEMQEVIEARAWWRRLYNEAEVELNEAYKAIDELKVKYSPLGEDILLDNISLRKKFFLESCRKANANLNEFKEYYLYLQELKKQEEEKLNKK